MPLSKPFKKLAPEIMESNSGLKDFLNPTLKKIGILAVLIFVIIILLVISRGGLASSPALSLIIILGWPLAFGTIGLVLELIYLHLIACSINKNPVFSLITLFVVAIVISYLLSVRIHGGEINPLAQCKAQIAAVPQCVNSTGSWDSVGCGNLGCSFAETGVSSACAQAFEGTGYYKDQTHFNCGNKPA